MIPYIYFTESLVEDTSLFVILFQCRLTEIVDNIGKDYFVWQDVFDYGVIVRVLCCTVIHSFYHTSAKSCQAPFSEVTLNSIL